MSNSKSKARQKAQVKARSAHAQKTAAQKAGGAKTTSAARTASTASTTSSARTTAEKKRVATRKTAATAPAPKSRTAKAKAVVTRTNKPAARSTAGKIEPKSGKLKAGDKAPAFNGQTATGEKYSLRQVLSVKGNKGTVVYFYPKAGTPGCTAEACDFRDSEAYFEAAGYSVVGISPDTPEQLQAFAKKQGLPFTLISDPDHKIAELYGVWDDGHRLGVKMLGQKSRLRRSTFVIDPKGKLVYAKYDVRAKDHVKRVRQALAI
jgi:thioredoxin-dependent peroxiredoxin